MKKILSKNNIKNAIKLQVFSLILLISLILIFSDFNSKTAKNMFHFGIATSDVPINVFGININSTKKYILLIIWIIITEAINTWSHKIYKNWYRNKVLDPKSKEVGMKNSKALWLINIWEIVVFIPKMFKWLILITTGQIQFLIPSFITRRLVSNMIDSKFLNEKEN
jgi:hypothetical protein